MDLVVCSPSSRVAEGACQTVRRRNRSPGVDSRHAGSGERDQPSGAFTRTSRRFSRADRSSRCVQITGSAAQADCLVDSFRQALMRRETSTHWGRRTSSITRQRRHGRHGRRSMRLLLDIGGDIVMWGRSCEIAIADPDACVRQRPTDRDDQSSQRGGRHERHLRARRAPDRFAQRASRSDTLRGRDGCRCRCGHRQCARHDAVPDQRRRRPSAGRVDARRRSAANRVRRAAANVGLCASGAAARFRRTAAR